MKIWNGYGSEHSTNLKMVGHFRDETAAKATEAIFKRLRDHLAEEMQNESWSPREGDELVDGTFELLRELKVWSLGPSDVENFGYDYSLSREGSDLILTTEENEVSGFLKLMIDNDAKIEVYSLHTHDQTGTRKTG